MSQIILRLKNSRVGDGCDAMPVWIDVVFVDTPSDEETEDPSETENDEKTENSDRHGPIRT